MGVEHVLFTPVEIDDGVCTGRPGGPPLWRAGKAAAVHDFAAAPRHRPDPELRVLQRRRGRPVPAHRRPGPGAQPGRGLADAAARTTPGPSRGSAAAAGGGPARASRAPRRRSAGCWAASAPGSAIGRSAARGATALDLGITLGGELGSALAGVRVDVQGAEHLAARPGGLPVQPPEPARRPDPGQAAARRLHRRGQEGAGATSRLRAGLPAGRRRLRRPRRHRPRPARPWSRRWRSCARASRWSSRPRAPGRPPRRSARSRRAPSTSPCRPACRSSRSSSATPAS